MSLIEVGCDYCGQAKYTQKMSFEQYCIVRCHCGLDYLSPRPDDETLIKLYSQDYFSSANFSEDLVEITEDSREKLIKQQAYLLAYIMPYFQTGKLLEIGCATGYFLEYARRSGFLVEGIEFSASAAKLASKLTQRPIFTGEIEAAIQKGFVVAETFDVVVMSHVLEHLKSPKVALQQVYSLLKPRGIAVIRVPDFGGFDAALKGKNWEGLRIPYHLYHFRPSTLKRYLQTVGFEILQFDYWIDSTIARPLSWLKHQFKAWLKRPTKECLAETATQLPQAASSPVTSSYQAIIKKLLYPLRGRTMTFVVRKP